MKNASVDTPTAEMPKPMNDMGGTGGTFPYWFRLPRPCWQDFPVQSINQSINSIYGKCLTFRSCYPSLSLSDNKSATVQPKVGVLASRFSPDRYHRISRSGFAIPLRSPTSWLWMPVGRALVSYVTVWNRELGYVEKRKKRVRGLDKVDHTLLGLGSRISLMYFDPRWGAPTNG